ncbi:MAG: DUF465 domain-containing protein [Bryobacter sp.]|nr:DUF465 domain-containing protein [Bryobacter sp.]
MMLLTEDDVKTQLMGLDPEFRRLAVQHNEYKRLLEEIEAKPYLNEAELAEEAHLKKVKLALKDQMQSIVARYAEQPV